MVNDDVSFILSFVILMAKMWISGSPLGCACNRTDQLYEIK